MDQDTKKPSPDMDSRLLALEQDLIGIAALIKQMPDCSPALADRYARTLSDLAQLQPIGAAGIAAVLRTFMREIEGFDYHAGIFPDLIRNAMRAAEELANDDFGNMVTIFRDQAGDDSTVVVPLEPNSTMLAAGALAGGIATDVARRVYAAMVSLCAQNGTPP